MPSLVFPKPLELCEQGNFEMLFKLHYDQIDSPGKSKIYGYHPSDYLTEPTFKNRKYFISNIETAATIAHGIEGKGLHFEGYQPIHYAVAHGNLKAVRKLVKKYKISPKSHDNLLSIACYHGHLEVFQYLAEDCDCYKAEKDKWHLHYILSNEVRDDKYMRLLDMPEDLYVGEIPFPGLKGKMGVEHIKMMQLLLKYQDRKFTHAELPTHLFQLILLRGQYEHLVFLEKFLERDAKTIISEAMCTISVNDFGTPNSILFVIASLLQYAFFGDNIPMVTELLNNGVITSNAMLILFAIRSSATREMLSVLVSQSSPELLYQKHNTFGGEESFIECIAHLAASDFSDIDISCAASVYFLLDLLIATYGSCVDSNQQNALHHICKSISLADPAPNFPLKEKIAHLLMSVLHPKNTAILEVACRYCDINASDKDGNTPMHIACLNSNWGVVNYLLCTKHVSIVTKNNEGMIPLHYINLHSIMEVKRFDYIAGEEDHNGNNLLHIACIRGSTPWPYVVNNIEDLVKAGVPIHKQNNNGQIPLHFVPEWNWSKVSAENNMKHIIDLLSSSQTCQAQDIKGNTPLLISCYRSINSSQLALVKCMLQKMPSSAAVFNNAGQLPIHIILGKYQIAVFKHMSYTADLPLLASLLDGIDVNLPDRNGNTPLHLACTMSAVYNNLIPFLLKSKAAFAQIQNSNGELPLHLLLKHGCSDPNLIKLLITNQSLCMQDKDGNTPLHLACMRLFSFSAATKCIDSAILLLVDESSSCFAYYPSSHFKPFLTSTLRLDAYRCFRIRNRNGHTPLQVLLNTLKFPRVVLEVVAMFCFDQAYSNDTAPGDDLCLHNCVKRIYSWIDSPNFVVFRALLNPINASIKNENGDTLLHSALVRANEDVIKYLLEQCNNIINTKNNQGNIPLHLACRYHRSPSVLKLLNIRSDDISALNNDGLAPIHLAVQYGNSLAVEYLQSIYKDALSIATIKGKLPIQLFFHTYIEKDPATPKTVRLRNLKMAKIFSKCDDYFHSLNAREKALLTQLACCINFVETTRYLKERIVFLAQNCSLKSPPYCHINRTQLLHMAAWFGRTDILQYLIREEKVDPQDVDEKGRNGLVYACRYPGEVTQYFECSPNPSRDAIQIFIEHGCSIFDEWKENFSNSEHQVTVKVLPRKP